jgi:hypothetical protein
MPEEDSHICDTIWLKGSFCAAILNLQAILPEVSNPRQLNFVDLVKKNTSWSCRNDQFALLIVAGLAQCAVIIGNPKGHRGWILRSFAHCMASFTGSDISRYMDIMT